MHSTPPPIIKRERDRGGSNWPIIIVLFFIHGQLLLWHPCLALVSLREYCDAFPDNLKPVICIIKENKIVAGTASTTIRSTTRSYNHEGWGWQRPPTESWGPPPPPPIEWHESSEESEESTACSCDLTCIPRLGGNATDSLQCKQCGNNCDVSTIMDPKCNCAAVGSGLSKAISGKNNNVPDTFDDNGDTDDYLDQPLHHTFGQLRQGMTGGQPSCNCTVTCAQRQRIERWDYGDDHEKEPPFCIFNITGLRSSSDRRPVTCECCKSHAALNTNFPDFVCICQRS